MEQGNLNGINFNIHGYDIDEDEEDMDLNADQPLYDGASINIRESMLLILTLLINHNLTMTCMEDIIRVIQLHCPNQNLVKNSLFKFRKFFNLEEDNDITHKHFYCTTCERELESEDDDCPSCKNSKNSYFITMPILKQLKEMFR